MRTLSVELSESAIKRYAADKTVRELNDLSLPLRFRFHSHRRSGQWYLVNYANNGAKWRSLGQWPHISFKLAKQKMQLQLVDISKPVDTGVFAATGDLLAWYIDRALSDKSLSTKRKSSMKSAFKNQLVPCLEFLPIGDISAERLDELFFIPLQKKYALSTVRNLFAMLKVAFRRAARLKKISHDPVADVEFSDFTKAKILPRPSVLTRGDLPALLSKFDKQDMVEKVFCWLLLVFGTRIGETRLARWDHIDFRNKTWFIPAKNTKTKQDHLLPIDDHMNDLLKSFYNWQSENGWGCVYVFSAGRSAMDHVTANTAIQMVSDKEWTAHHLRKLARSCWMDMGIDYMVCEFLLNHAKDKLDAAYIHTHAEKLKREAIAKWVAFLLEEKPR